MSHPCAAFIRLKHAFLTLLAIFVAWRSYETKHHLFKVFSIILALFSTAAFAEDLNERLNKIEESFKNQQRTIEQQQKIIDTLKTQVNQQGDQGSPGAAPAPSSPKASGLFGGSAFTNPNMSVVFDTFGYSSNLTNDELSNRGISGSQHRDSTSARGSMWIDNTKRNISFS